MQSGYLLDGLNLATTYGVYVEKTKGPLDFLKRKGKTAHSWLDSHGEEALIQVMKKKPDLILLDIMMPKMNGVETLKRLKEEEKTRMIPVIILSNLGDNPRDIEAAKKLGALDYLVKANITLKELSERIKKAIEIGK